MDYIDLLRYTVKFIIFIYGFLSILLSRLLATRQACWKDFLTGLFFVIVSLFLPEQQIVIGIFGVVLMGIGIFDVYMAMREGYGISEGAIKLIGGMLIIAIYSFLMPK